MLQIRLLREAGGLGDVVRTFSVAQGLKKLYYPCHITMVCLRQYWSVYNHCNAIDGFVLIDKPERRPRFGPCDPGKYPYLKGQYDWTIDLYCPALLHEHLTRGACTKDRTELFCEAAGVEPSKPVYIVEPGELKWAGGYLDFEKPIIGIAPLSYDRKRSWVLDKWVKLIEMLERDYAVIVFDCNRDWRLNGFPGHHVFNIPLAKLAALMKKCRALCTVDTGPFHLAGALDVPTVGLFASTNGELMKKWYPTHRIITPRGYPKGYRFAGGKRIECQPPCYHRRERGCRADCIQNGCALMSDIFVEDVYKKIKGVADKKLKK